MVRVALAYAKRGIPVFRLRPGTKEPFHGSRGFYDATTDEEQVRELWRKSPDANVAYPTGKASGLLVLDEDPRHGGTASLEALEAEHGKLPATTKVRTPSDGRHLYFKYPAGEKIGNSAGKLGAGLDVRGEGGYVVAPGSSTPQGRYEWIDTSPPADAPEWLLEALRGPHSASTAGVRTTPTAPMPAAGETIPEGSRNDAMYRVACGLRARGMDEAGILEELEETNAVRCSPPLELEELEKIAASASRHAPGNAGHEVTPETLEALDTIDAAIQAASWPGTGGKSERDAMIALVKHAREHGTSIPAGVRVSVSVRELALLAAISKRSLLDYKKNGEWKPGVINRLRRKGWIRRDDLAKRRDGEAGAFVLVAPNAQFHHSNHYGSGRSSGETLRSPYSAPRLRHSAPGIKRLGKSVGEGVDKLEIAGGISTVREQAEALRMRPYDYRIRVLAPLAAAGVVKCSGEAVSFAPDWLDAIERERERGGEIAAERRDRKKYADESDAYRNRHRHEAHHAPTPAEMRERRASAPARRRDAIGAAIGRLFSECPEYRDRRVGQITCAIINMGLPDDFPRGVGAGGAPKDHEIAAILEDNGVDVVA